MMLLLITLIILELLVNTKKECYYHTFTYISRNVKDEKLEYFYKKIIHFFGAKILIFLQNVHLFFCAKIHTLFSAKFQIFYKNFWRENSYQS